jgi:hypothetical protein
LGELEKEMVLTPGADMTLPVVELARPVSVIVILNPGVF